MPSKIRAFCHEGKWHDIEVEDDNCVKEFDRVAKINENVIRHLVINLDK